MQYCDRTRAERGQPNTTAPGLTRPLGYHPFATFEAAGKKFYLDELGDMHDPSFQEMLEERMNA